VGDQGSAKCQGELDNMSSMTTNLFVGAMVVFALVVMVETLLQMNKNKRWADVGSTPAGIQLVSRARYRGRRVAHYSDGSVLAETRFGFKPFESFEMYQRYIDR